MKFQPTSRTGRWAIGLEMAFLLLMVAKFTPIRFPFPSLLIFPIGIAGFVVAMIAIIRKDRAFAVWLALIIGLMPTLWTLGELLWPH